MDPTDFVIVNVGRCQYFRERLTVTRPLLLISSGEGGEFFAYKNVLFTGTFWGASPLDTTTSIRGLCHENNDSIVKADLRAIKIAITRKPSFCSIPLNGKYHDRSLSYLRWSESWQQSQLTTTGCASKSFRFQGVISHRD